MINESTSEFELTVDVMTVEDVFFTPVPDPSPEPAIDTADTIDQAADVFVFDAPEIPVIEDIQPAALTPFEQNVVDLLAAGDFNPFNWEFRNEFGGVDQDLFWAVSRLHNDLDAAGIAPENYAATATEWFLQS